MSVFGLILDIGKQQIITHSNPDLSHHSILGCAEKGFYFEILLYPLEKQFNLYWIWRGSQTIFYYYSMNLTSYSLYMPCLSKRCCPARGGKRFLLLPAHQRPFHRL